MPKLKGQTLERNQLRIEDAALELFTRQGYHGTSVREIADRAGVSLGNIYNYYPTKEEIYSSLVRRYAEQMARLQSERLLPLVGSFDPQSLTQLAAAVRVIVSEYSDYWRLMYIDVVEFQNAHFSYLFQDFPSQLRQLNPGAFARIEGEGRVPPEFAFAAVYLQFFVYFITETLFGGRQHMGVPEDEAIARIIELATAGWRANRAFETVQQPAEAHGSGAVSRAAPRRSDVARRSR